LAGALETPRLFVYLNTDALEGLSIHLDLDDAAGLRLTVAEARALAASLLEAAELLEETGEQGRTRRARPRGGPDAQHPHRSRHRDLPALVH
jgi:hypothetical protein